MESLSATEAMEVFAREQVAHLAVVTEGEPYVTPISFVMDGGNLLFRTAAGRRLEAIRTNPRVCVEASTVDGETGNWESALLWGDAYEVNDPNLQERVVQLILEKYRAMMGSPLRSPWGLPLPSLAHVVAVPGEVVTGMCSGKGFSPRTRPGRL